MSDPTGLLTKRVTIVSAPFNPILEGRNGTIVAAGHHDDPDVCGLFCILMDADYLTPLEVAACRAVATEWRPPFDPRHAWVEPEGFKVTSC